MNIGPDKFN